MLHKLLSIIILLNLFALDAVAQKTSNKNLFDSSKKINIVAASCGECQFKMLGRSCDLAVRIDGKSYFVDGTTIDAWRCTCKRWFLRSCKKSRCTGGDCWWKI